MKRPETRRRRLLAALCGLAVVSGVGTATAMSVATAPPPHPDLVITPLASGTDDSDDPTTTAAPNADPAAASAQSALVAAEDDRISLGISGPQRATRTIQKPGGPPTTVLAARSAPYTLDSLVSLGAVERQPDGSWLMTRSVIVGKGATLHITAPGGTLRMASGPGGYVSLIAFKASLTLEGEDNAPLHVISWDGTHPDTNLVDGRSYVRAIASRMDLTRVSVDSLGFWSGRTGGLAWTGTAALPATGSAANSVVANGQYGVFASRTRDLAITDTISRRNALDGLLVHRESTGFVARHVVANENGRDGLALTKGAAKATISDSTANGNRSDGVHVDGTPPSPSPLAGAAAAVGAAAGGPSAADTDPATHKRAAGFVVERTTLRDNASDGIAVISADDVALRRNTVAAPTDGITLRGPSEGAQISDNTVTAGRFGIAISDGAKGVAVTANVVPSSGVAAHISDSAASVRSNTFTANRYAVALVGQVTGSAVADNHLAGSGLAPIDTVRIAPPSIADILTNDVDDFAVEHDEVAETASFVSDHPLILLWGLMAVLIVAAAFARRRWNRREVAHPYEHQRQETTEEEYVGTDTSPAPIVLPDRRALEVGEGPDAESTAALPVTRVTLVSSGTRT